MTGVDAQVGLIQRIACGSSRQAAQNSCHMLEGTIATLLKSCGDERGRFFDAKFSFGLHEFARQTWKASKEQRETVGAGIAMAAIAILVLVLPDSF